MKCAIVAGTEEQAKSYAARKRLEDWYFVKEPGDLREHGPVRVEMTGTWYSRTDRPALAFEIEALKRRGESL